MHGHERSPAPPEREKHVPSDAQLLTHIVDIEETAVRNEPKISEELDAAVARIEAGMVGEAVASTVARMREDRERSREGWRNALPAQVFEYYMDSASRESHAIQCSVNKEIDLGVLRDAVRREHNDAAPAVQEDAAYVEVTIDRQIRMNRIMSEIYTADILRRIGLRKGDEGIVDMGLARLDAVREDLLASLTELEEANMEKVRATPGLTDLLMGLRASATNAPRERLRTMLYTEIAEPYSMAIGYDIEDFNEQELREALERLETGA